MDRKDTSPVEDIDSDVHLGDPRGANGTPRFGRGSSEEAGEGRRSASAPSPSATVEDDSVSLHYGDDSYMETESEDLDRIDDMKSSTFRTKKRPRADQGFERRGARGS